jgi:hypothetical protein
VGRLMRSRERDRRAADGGGERVSHGVTGWRVDRVDRTR